MRARRARLCLISFAPCSFPNLGTLICGNKGDTPLRRHLPTRSKYRSLVAVPVSRSYHCEREGWRTVVRGRQAGEGDGGSGEDREEGYGQRGGGWGRSKGAAHKGRSHKKRTVNVQVGGGRAATTFRRYKSARRWRHLWEETKPKF